jgi:nucleoside-diphosphate-sugar epimerase
VKGLVIGGTGPTGPPVVNGLIGRGYDVTILHSGRHEVDTIPGHVEHVHTDAFDIAAVAGSLGERSFDAVFAMYGRLRDLAPYFVGRCGKFVSVGGMPVYHGFTAAELWHPPGMPIPTREDAPRAQPGDVDKVVKMVQTEDVVFASHPTASHFRYPRIYGPGQVLPREWLVVRRILDGRRQIILPDDGLTLMTAAYSENAAHALLLSLDRPDASAGQAYNVSDEHTLTTRQMVEVIAAALDHPLEMVPMPWALATTAYPLIDCETAHHRVMSVENLRHQLGYRDVVPAVEALATTARWLADHPVPRGSVMEQGLQDPFDYEAEDRLIATWIKARDELMVAAEAARGPYVDRYARSSVGAHLKLDR